MPIRSHSTRLSDGRELIYFDDEDTALGETRAIDQRILDTRPETPVMRMDVLTGDWVSVAATRQNRAFLPPKEFDPLAPQTADNPSEIPDNYDVAVFENKSPSFGPGLPEAPLSDDERDGLYGLGWMKEQPAIGRCEVVCFSPESEGSFGSLSETRARTVIEAWAHRTEALSRLPGIEQVFVFENRGEEIGVTLPHPHGQIYAYPFVTPRTRRVLGAVETFGPDFFATLLANEQTSERVIARTEHFTAFVPFAARWPLEIHLLPHRHVHDLSELSEEEKADLAPLYLSLVRSLDAIYDSPTPYIAAWHQAPVHLGRDSIRLMLQITSPRRQADKLKFLAGSEAAMGAFIADVTPEAQADLIRSTGLFR
ncbi:MAG: galactose-1-phosphate uridylyltransferase [Pontimonas sp.]